MNELEQMLDEIGQVAHMDPTVVDNLSDAVKQQIELEDLQARINEIASEISRKLQFISEKKIPDLMADLGVESMTLEDGSSLEVKPFYSGKIVSDKTLDWLREHGHGDLIKHNVTVKFGAGEDELANELMEGLATTGYNFEEKTTVHSSTLRAFIREQCEQGDPPPKALFNTYIGNRAKIKRKKGK